MNKFIYIPVLVLTLISCARKSYLDGSEFCQLRILTPNMMGNFFYYKFYSQYYQIKVVVQGDRPSASYILEEGKYFVKDSNLTFMPRSQLFFKQEYTNISGPCSTLWIFENTFKVIKDSLNNEEITKFKFTKRIAPMNVKNGIIYISDPRYQFMNVSNNCR